MEIINELFKKIISFEIFGTTVKTLLIWLYSIVAYVSLLIIKIKYSKKLPWFYVVIAPVFLPIAVFVSILLTVFTQTLITIKNLFNNLLAPIFFAVAQILFIIPHTPEPMRSFLASKEDNAILLWTHNLQSIGIILGAISILLLKYLLRKREKETLALNQDNKSKKLTLSLLVVFLIPVISLFVLFDILISQTFSSFWTLIVSFISFFIGGVIENLSKGKFQINTLWK